MTRYIHWLEHRPWVFLSIVWIKIFDGILGAITGIFLFIAPKEKIVTLMATIFQHELLEDPTDIFARVVLHYTGTATLSGQHFLGMYLLANGMMKILLFVLILQKKYWAYPVAAFGIGLLFVYEAYRYIAISHAPLLAVLMVIDVYVIYHILQQYRYIKMQL